MDSRTLSLPSQNNDKKRKLDFRHYSAYFPQNSFEILLKEKAMKDFLGIDDNVYSVEGMYDSIYSQKVLLEKSKMKYFDEINDKLYQIFIDLDLNPEDSSLMHFKEDMLIVFVFNQITIKIYKLDDFERNKMDKLYSVLSKNECKYLEEIKKVYIYKDLEIVAVVSKTIKMLHSAFDNIKSDMTHKVKPTEDIFEDIQNALNYLRNNYWAHRDTLLDNIGFDTDKDCFVLFDFEKSKNICVDEDLNEEYYRDMRSLSKSFEFYLDNVK
jgi:hypothetical protein